jgi:GNAT superfamily N-acetyltransferase
MTTDFDFESLYDGLQIDSDLVVKASLRIDAKPMRHPVMESLSSDLVAKYRTRMNRLIGDITGVLEEDDDSDDKLVKAELVFTGDGRVLFKATGAPKAPKVPKAQPKTVMPSGERRLTPSGYVHVEAPGARGGKFWRDAKGNVRYGEQPQGTFNIPASPQHVVEHYRKYYAPQPFAAHDQRDMHAALMDSEVLTDEDHAFMEWWHDSYDDVLDLLADGMTRKDVEKAGGLHNITFKVGGRSVGIGEAIEELFKQNSHLFVGDPQYGDLESPEDVVDAVRGLMDRYNKALHEDPKVQALAQANAAKADAEKHAFYLQCEQTASEFDSLAGDVVTSEDPNDLAARMTVAMGQMGLIEKGGKGKVAQRRMRGAIVPKSALLLQDKRNMGDLWQDNQLERLNAAQLMAVYVATEAQQSFSRDNVYEYEPGVANQARDDVFNMICTKLGIDDDDTIAKQTLQRKLEKTTEATLRAFSAHNEGQDPHFSDLMKMKMKDVGGGDVMKEHMQKVSKEQARIEEILAAQEDTTFEPPPSMANGVWNGKTLKDPKDPSKGVWAPFEYQKKYINWMLKVKRGVIAADAGMGKTPTVIAFRELLAHQGKDTPAICFLPPSLMEQWPAAVAKFAPENQESILNLGGMSLEERKAALQEEMKKDPKDRARYVFISTGTLTGEVPDPNATEEEDDGTGGTDHELVKILQSIEGAVFIDEAHQGGYKKAGNTRHEIAKAVMKDREYAFGMTATPMPNDPTDVYHLANLFAPGSVGDMDLWQGRMAGVAFNRDTQQYEVSNPEHLADLNKRLKPFVFYKSVTDPDVVADMKKGLPKKTGVHENPEMHPDEGDLDVSHDVHAENGLSQHDYFKEDGVIDAMVALRMQRLVSAREEKVAKGELNPDTGEPYEPYHPAMLNLMAGGMQITLQRQASISPGLIDPSYRKADGSVVHTPKVKAICDDIIAHFSNGGQGGKDAKPLVVFCSYPGKAYPIIRKALAERGVDPSLIETISGEVPPHERGYMQDKLNKGHSKVLLVGTMSGGAGLNLQEAANKTLFLDEPWNPAAKRQAIGRVWRTGQTNDTVYEKTYRSRGTFDMEVEQKIAGKQAMVAALLGKDLPTSESFNAEGAIKELLGRVKGTQFSEEQIKAIMQGSKDYDMGSAHHKQAEILLNEHWQNIAAEGGAGGHGASFTDKDFEPDKKAQAGLKKKGADALTKPFDEKEFRGKWEMDRDKRRSKQNFEMANLMAQIYRQKGETGKAEQYERKAQALAKQYPELSGGKANDNSGKKATKEQTRATATVSDAEVKNKYGGKTTVTTRKPEAVEETKDVLADLDSKTKTKQQGVKNETAKPTPVETKVVKRHKALGVDFHTEDNPFKEGSSRKVRGSDISHAEAHFVLSELKSSKHKSWDDFIKEHVKPIWDDEQGRNPFSMKAAHEYVGKIVDAIQSQGVLTANAEPPKQQSQSQTQPETQQKPGVKTSAVAVPKSAQVSSDSVMQQHEQLRQHIEKSNPQLHGAIESFTAKAKRKKYDDPKVANGNCDIATEEFKQAHPELGLKKLRYDLSTSEGRDHVKKLYGLSDKEIGAVDKQNKERQKKGYLEPEDMFHEVLVTPDNTVVDWTANQFTKRPLPFVYKLPENTQTETREHSSGDKPTFVKTPGFTKQVTQQTDNKHDVQFHSKVDDKLAKELHAHRNPDAQSGMKGHLDDYRDKQSVAVARDHDGKIKGWASFINWGKKNPGQLSVYVDKQHRGKGVADSLLTNLLPKVKDHTHSQVEVDAGEAHVKSLYDKHLAKHGMTAKDISNEAFQAKKEMKPGVPKETSKEIVQARRETIAKGVTQDGSGRPTFHSGAQKAIREHYNDMAKSYGMPHADDGKSHVSTVDLSHGTAKGAPQAMYSKDTGAVVLHSRLAQHLAEHANSDPKELGKKFPTVRTKKIPGDEIGDKNPVSAYHVMLHETVHAHGPRMTPLEGPGLMLEEFVTEMGARKITSDVHGLKMHKIDASYNHLVNPVAIHLLGMGDFSEEDVHKAIGEAAIDVKKQTAKTITPEETLRQMSQGIAKRLGVQDHVDEIHDRMKSLLDQ